MAMDMQQYLRVHAAMQQDPKIFMKLTMPGKFIYPFGRFHDIVIDRILFRRKIITLIMIFRGAGKTTLIEAGLALYLILYHGIQNIIFTSEAGKQAREFLLHPKRVLLSDPFKFWFGNFKGNIWNQETLEIINEKMGIYARILARGSDEQFSGVNVDIQGKSVRPQIIFCDDIVNQFTAANYDQVKKVLDWIDTTLEPSLHDENSGIIFIGTPYNSLNALLELEKRKSVHTLRFPALVMGRHKEKISKMLGIPEGKSIWEANPKFTTARLRAKMQEAIDENKLHAFWSQYILEPLADSGTRFNENNIGNFHLWPMCLQNWNTYLLIDSAYKGGKRNDNIAIVLAGMDDYENLFLIDYFEGKCTENQLYEKVIGFIKKYQLTTLNLKRIGIESTMFDWMAAHLREKLAMHGMRFVIEELKHKNRSKADRIQRLISVCDDQRLFIQKHHTSFLAQMLQFDAGSKDQSGLNALDAFAYILDVGTAPQIIRSAAAAELENQRLWSEFMGPEAYFYGTHYKYFDDRQFLKQKSQIMRISNQQLIDPFAPAMQPVDPFLSRFGGGGYGGNYWQNWRAA